MESILLRSDASHQFQYNFGRVSAPIKDFELDENDEPLPYLGDLDDDVFYEDPKVTRTFQGTIFRASDNYIHYLEWEKRISCKFRKINDHKVLAVCKKTNQYSIFEIKTYTSEHSLTIKNKEVPDEMKLSEEETSSIKNDKLISTDHPDYLNGFDFPQNDMTFQTSSSYGQDPSSASCFSSQKERSS